MEVVVRSWKIVTAFVLVMFASACTPPATDASSLVARANDRNHLTVGTRFDQPGLSERKLDGQIVGFDVDVVKFIAAELGVAPKNITWRETSPNTRETDISSGAVDLIASTYSITDKRRQLVSFAGPYFITGQDLLVRQTSMDITGPESLNGRKLCSQPGTTSAQQVRDRFAMAVQLVEYPRFPDCVTALLAGQVDAVTTDAAILAGYVTQNPELLRVVGKPFSAERYGIGLRKGDTEGQTAINNAIKKMIGNGAWAASLNSNIGPSGYRLPPPPEVTEHP
jgi:glutamate transport system substrate-binding protein